MHEQPRHAAVFRLYGPLNDFVPAARRQREIHYEFSGRPSVKDAIESLGPPHVEVTHVLVDGEAVGFDHPLENGARVAAYPESTEFDGLPRATPPPGRPVRFVLDTHLRRLAVYLRLVGCDVVWIDGCEDPRLAAISAKEARTLLTRDLGLLKRSIVVHGRWVRSTDPRVQLREIVDAYDLRPELQPFTRCVRCNALVVDVRKADVLERLRPGTARSFDAFRWCPDCDRVYWRGAHHERLLALVRSVLPAWNESGLRAEDGRAGEPQRT